MDRNFIVSNIVSAALGNITLQTSRRFVIRDERVYHLLQMHINIVQAIQASINVLRLSYGNRDTYFDCQPWFWLIMRFRFEKKIFTVE